MTNEWIKWWKNKTFMTILGIALVAMVVSFLLAYFIEWGWILSIVVACIGGFLIRRVISKKMDEVVKDIEDNNNNLKNKYYE